MKNDSISQTMKSHGQTFVLHIKSCENSSWQGTVEWIEKKKTIPFRSVLELIKLLDSAVQEGNEGA